MQFYLKPFAYYFCLAQGSYGWTINSVAGGAFVIPTAFTIGWIGPFSGIPDDSINEGRFFWSDLNRSGGSMELEDWGLDWKSGLGDRRQSLLGSTLNSRFHTLSQNQVFWGLWKP